MCIRDRYYVAKDNSFGLQEFEKLMESNIFKDFSLSEEDYGCYLLKKEDTSVILQNRLDKLLFIRTLRDPQKNFELRGYLLLGVNLEHLRNFCQSFLKEDTSALAVYDKKGNQIFSVRCV